VPIGDPEVAAERANFQALIRVHRQSSHYILRVLARVTDRHPATVGAVSDDLTLRTLALGRLAASERHPNAEEQKGLLGDFYDIEFLRIAMGTLRGEPDANARTAFADLTATYLDRLFDFCFRQADREAGGRVPQRERLGIFLAGGNARRRPYDEDYDLLALIDSSVPEDQQFAERVVLLMNRQIARRGVVAQYRLGEHFRRFVTTLDELVELLSRDDGELFVDRCQIIGSRCVVGSRRIEEQLESRVLRPLVFAGSDRFVARVAQEIAERRRAFHPLAKGMIHLKETPGGLREIDLSLAVAKARLGVWDSSQANPFFELSRRDPGRAALYEGLGAISAFLVAVRSTYRVAVAATDEIERSRLDGPARNLGYAPDGVDPAHQLFADIEARMAESATLVDELVAG
jgi:UTP:GlnB (protein PII) uridylyltransferase